MRPQPSLKLTPQGIIQILAHICSSRHHWKKKIKMSSLCLISDHWSIYCDVRKRIFGVYFSVLFLFFISRSGFTVDIGEVKTAPSECKEKCFHMMSSAYLHYSKAPQNVLMIHLRKRSARWAIYMNRKFQIYIESAPVFQMTSVTIYRSWVLTQQVKNYNQWSITPMSQWLRPGLCQSI